MNVKNKFKVISKKYNSPAKISNNYPNDETLAAMTEAKDIACGKIPAKSFSNVEELMKDLLDDADD